MTVVNLTDLELAGLACIVFALAFMLGHAAGYWRAKDVERRRDAAPRARVDHPCRPRN